MSDILAARAARAAGFRDEALRTILAIGFDECRALGAEDDASELVNDTRAFTVRDTDGRWLNPSTGESIALGFGPEYSVGQWQINILAHPELSEDDCRDYMRAANIAYLLYRERGDFTAWSTFLDGSYVEYYSRADIAIAATMPDVAESSLYTVAEGDSLSGIAERFYGDGALWGPIYEANADKIGLDPNMILVGAQLFIPALDWSNGLAPVDNPVKNVDVVDNGLAPDAPVAEVAAHADAGAVGLTEVDPRSERNARIIAALDAALAILGYEAPEDGRNISRLRDAIGEYSA